VRGQLGDKDGGDGKVSWESLRHVRASPRDFRASRASRHSVDSDNDILRAVLESVRYLWPTVADNDVAVDVLLLC
jgi:hypothetical protein